MATPNPNPNMMSIEDMRIEPYEGNPNLYVIKADVKSGGETMTWQSIPTTENSVKYFQKASPENRISMFKGFCQDFSQAYHDGSLDAKSMSRTFSANVPIKSGGVASINNIRIEKVGAHSDAYRISAFVQENGKSKYIHTEVDPSVVEKWLAGNPQQRAESFRYMFPYSGDKQAIAAVPVEKLTRSLSFDINIAENIKLQNDPLKKNVSQQDKVMITAVIGGQNFNIELSAKEQQKMMAMDESHRMRLLESIAPGVKELSPTEKIALMESVNNQLFSRPQIFASAMSESSSETAQQKPAVSASSLAAASYTAILAESQDNSLEQSMSRGI